MMLMIWLRSHLYTNILIIYYQVYIKHLYLIEFTDIIYNTFNRHLNKSLILTGDFNININNNNSHTSTNFFIDTYSLFPKFNSENHKTNPYN